MILKILNKKNKKHLIIRYSIICLICYMIFFNVNILNNNQHVDIKNISKSELKIYAPKNDHCSFSKCFDMKKCKKFKIYIYKHPIIIKSPIYRDILSILKKSKYYTRNPNKACLFIPSIDTLDQDRLSKNYVRGAGSLISKLKYWNNGKNHLIFNMYSGTWPNYKEEIEFDVEHAILIKSSISARNFRKNFDISFPLIHADFPLNKTKLNKIKILNFNNRQKKYFLTFKGKRYLHGIGSDVRNKLYHLNNHRDVILLTTCKHGYEWKKFQDERCDEDNRIYNKYEYNDLLNNSTFCLIPRGRRVGTYRFLEALKVGCIAVISSDGWILPFSEIIDWKKAIIWIKENELMQVTSILREIPIEKIIEMRKWSLFFFEKYFSSLDTIIETTMSIFKKRIENVNNFKNITNI